MQNYKNYKKTLIIASFKHAANRMGLAEYIFICPKYIKKRLKNDENIIVKSMATGDTKSIFPNIILSDKHKWLLHTSRWIIIMFMNFCLFCSKCNIGIRFKLKIKPKNLTYYVNENKILNAHLKL